MVLAEFFKYFIFKLYQLKILTTTSAEAATYTDEGPQPAWDMYEMIQAFLQAPSYHVIFEVLLILWIVGLLLTQSYKNERTLLTDKEKEELIAEWQPDPLVPDMPEDDPALDNMMNRVVDSKLGKHVIINGKECLNVATMNFLGMVGRSDIEEVAIKSLRKYGVGSCGPRGFYGTVDVHLKLEERLAEFMGCEEAIIYSYGFATVASAIPAYSKRGDVIFCDNGVHFAIQKGVQASRSRVKYFKHNDMDDLERLLQEQAEDDKQNPKKAKATRRFLIVEGLYQKYGDICPLPKLVELKWKYKVRIFMDETISFGTLGKTGKGVTEYYNVPLDEIDLVTASLENSLGTTGGFCCGKAYVIDHQRLSGLGYCFSASCPPMLSQATIEALDIMENSPELMERLHKNSQLMHAELSKLEHVKIIGEPVSPILYLELGESLGSRHLDRNRLNQAVQYAEDKGLALTVAAYLNKDEINLPPPRIRVSVSAELTRDEIDCVASVIKGAVANILKG